MTITTYKYKAGGKNRTPLNGGKTGGNRGVTFGTNPEKEGESVDTWRKYFWIQREAPKTMWSQNVL